MRYTPEPTARQTRATLVAAFMAVLTMLCGAGRAAAADNPTQDGGRAWPLAGRPVVVRGWEPPADA
ncbi:M23 family peptidase, partial [Streptomyces sp. NPDC002596]